LCSDSQPRFREPHAAPKHLLCGSHQAFNNIIRCDYHNFSISDVKFCSSRIGNLRLCNELLCGRHASHIHCSGKQGRIKGGQRGQLPRAPRWKGAPRNEIYLFQIKYSFEKFRDSEAIQEYNYIIFLCCVIYQGPQQELISLQV